MTDIKLTNKEASRVISTPRTAQYVLTLGLVFAEGATCYAQSDAPIIQERPQEVGPATQDRVIQDRTIQRERVGDRTLVKERVVERRREGEVYVGGFGGFTWGHDYVRFPACVPWRSPQWWNLHCRGNLMTIRANPGY